MPTTNPRVNVTLSVSLDALVGRMAGHTRVSKSQVLRELLEAAEPALQRAVALMDAAGRASAAVKLRIGSQLDKGQTQAEDSLAAILANLEGVTGDLVSMAEAVQGKRPARRLPASAERPPAAAGRVRSPKNPPASNRGVKSTATRGKQANSLRAKRRSA